MTLESAERSSGDRQEAEAEAEAGEDRDEQGTVAALPRSSTRHLQEQAAGAQGTDRTV